MLSPEEYRYLYLVCRSYGYPYDEFEISNFYLIKNDQTTSTSLTTVVVRHIKLKICKAYTAGCGNYWLLAFDRDLATGLFSSETCHIIPPDNFHL